MNIRERDPKVKPKVKYVDESVNVTSKVTRINSPMNTEVMSDVGSNNMKMTTFNTDLYLGVGMNNAIDKFNSKTIVKIK